MEISSKNGLIFIDVDVCKPSSVDAVKKERSPTPTQTLEVPEQTPRTKCKECPFTSTSNERMIRHIRRVHLGQKPFQCSVCTYATSNSVRYAEHANGHLGIKPYSCRFCPYRSVSKKYMTMHEGRHGTCEKCGYKAKNKRALQRHYNTECSGCHTAKVKPCKEEPNAESKLESYTCKSCKMTFDSIEMLRKHKKNHQSCTYCKQSFIKSVLTQHIKKVHGIESEIKKKVRFQCKLCAWQSNYHQKILLHLIHHPDQEVSDSIDITPLVKCGILVGHARS